jgi:hypothetical protein
VGNKVRFYKDEHGNRGLHFHCLGCGNAHGIFIEGCDVPIWTWNGSMETPSFQPSILVQGYLGEKDGTDMFGVCHSYVTDGKIQFLNDCFHELKGQTVDLPDF